MKSSRSPLHRCFLLTGLTLAALWALSPNAEADPCTGQVSCGFNTCKTPSEAPPPHLWSRLEPVDRNGLPTGTSSSHQSRDTTWNLRNGFYSLSRPYWQSIDIENGWLYTGVNLGLQVWSLSNPRQPVRHSNLSSDVIPSLFQGDHETFLIRDVDAPKGNSDVLTMTGGGAMGMVVWDTNGGGSPQVIYQDGGESGNKYGGAVYATTIQGRHYGFLAAYQLQGAGLWMYDLSAALDLPTVLCVERRPSTVNPSCNGVFQGKLSNSAQTHVDGTGLDGVGHWVVFSGGNEGDGGFEVWNISNPDQPAPVMDGLTSERVHGAAMWMREGRLYLATAVRFTDEGRIYDVSCLLSGGSCTLPAPLYVFPLDNDSGEAVITVTYSESNGRPFVYFGRRDGWVFDSLQQEWLFDVSSLPAGDPTEVTGGDPRNGNSGQPTDTVSGSTVGYWSWYYSCHPTGSNFFEPADGMFWGPYFYRAGSSILDIHELTDAPVDPLIFDSGFETGNVVEWSASEGAVL